MDAFVVVHIVGEELAGEAEGEAVEVVLVILPGFVLGTLDDYVWDVRLETALKEGLESFGAIEAEMLLGTPG